MVTCAPVWLITRGRIPGTGHRPLTTDHHPLTKLFERVFAPVMGPVRDVAAGHRALSYERFVRVCRHSRDPVG